MTSRVGFLPSEKGSARAQYIDKISFEHSSGLMGCEIYLRDLYRRETQPKVLSENKLGAKVQMTRKETKWLKVMQTKG